MRFVVKSFKVYTKKVYQNRIAGQLKSGWIIDIFDYEGFDLAGYKGQEVEGLVFADIAPYRSDVDFRRISGVFIKKVPQGFINKWLSYGTSFGPENYSAIRTQDGIFLIDKINPDHYSTDKEDNLNIDIARFELFAWHLIEE